MKRVFSKFYFLPITKITEKLLIYFSASPCMQLLNTSIQQQNVQPARGMANLKAIAIRLKSVKNIQKITQSMKMVSAAKYARAERDLKVSSSIYWSHINYIHWSVVVSFPSCKVFVNILESATLWYWSTGILRPS